MKAARSVSASVLAVANFDKAKASGVSVDVEKSMEEKVWVPDVTSGTEEMVLTELEQVMEDWMEVTVSITSWGRVIEPMMKHAFARGERGAGVR